MDSDVSARVNTALPLATEASEKLCNIPNHSHDKQRASTNGDQTKGLDAPQRTREGQTNNTGNDIDTVKRQLGVRPGLRFLNSGRGPILGYRRRSSLLRVGYVGRTITTRVLLETGLLLLFLLLLVECLGRVLCIRRDGRDRRSRRRVVRLRRGFWRHLVI
jgi:hypothetical protein